MERNILVVREHRYVYGSTVSQHSFCNGGDQDQGRCLYLVDNFGEYGISNWKKLQI